MKSSNSEIQVKNDNRPFILTDEEYEKYSKWRKKHIKTCPADVTTIGGRLTFEFTPTGMGDIIIVRCVCGACINLTDYTKW